MVKSVKLKRSYLCFDSETCVFGEVLILLFFLIPSIFVN